MTKGFDLLQPFSSLAEEQDQKYPDLHLAANLNKVGAVLGTYAESLKCAVEQLTVLHICVDDSTLHPDLVRKIDTLPISKEYKGQNRSRIKLLVRNLPWPVKDDECDDSGRSLIVEQLPEYLRGVWCFLSRGTQVHSAGITTGDETSEAYEAYLRERAKLHLSKVGICIGLALLETSKRYGISEIRQLLEEHSSDLKAAIRRRNHPSKWNSLLATMRLFTGQVREYLKYPVEKKDIIRLQIDDLPEPLKTQICIYENRARYGFKSDVEIKIRARSKYKLDLSPHAPETIKDYIGIIRLGLGYIPREMYGDTLDLRDLLTLEARDVEVEGVIITELHNPLVDYYRRREQIRSSYMKEEGFDSKAFHLFIQGITAVAAFNGFLELRKKFLKEYDLVLDVDSKNERKLTKKEVYDRPWLDGEILRLKPLFHRAATEGAFKSSDGLSLTNDQRYDLNLCLFYVALLTLRFVGVRQQCIRDCILDENIFLIKSKSVTFQWTDEEIKNRKGIRHGFSLPEHEETHKLLIEGVWVYYRHVYPYVSGTDNGLPFHIKAMRRKAVAGQFFLKCKKNGLCVPFTHESEFFNWFRRQCLAYLDFEGRLGEDMRGFGPHFLRAVFSDWACLVLEFSKDDGAKLVADEPETFDTDYVTHPRIYDATALWTEKNHELRRKRKRT
jgi:hypothetical protein